MIRRHRPVIETRHNIKVVYQAGYNHHRDKGQQEYFYTIQDSMFSRSFLYCEVS